MNVLAALAAFAVTGLTSAIANDIVDDSTCVWKTSTLSCQPSALCSYQYEVGDLTLSESCRVKPGVDYYPQQLHLAYAGETTGTGMIVSWATFAEVSDPTLWVGTSADSLEVVDVTVSSVSYITHDDYDLFHHHATVSGLTPNTVYYYKVGSESQATYQSDVSTFKTARSADDTSTFNMIIYGDAGYGDNSAGLVDYVNTLGTSDVDLIYHLGDISYADDDYLTLDQASGFFYEEVYNAWMNSLMPIMSQVPYMVLPGNHDAECHSPYCQVSSVRDLLDNFTAFNTRFKMPSSESSGTLNMWYSFEHGPIHFTSISSESDFTGAPTDEFTLTSKNGNFGDQLAWLEADLEKAAANRDSIPWIIVGMHRPIYDVAMASSSTGDITDSQTLAIQAAFEALFIKYKVDIVLTGHEHYYERQMPIANNAAVSAGVSSDKKTYSNAAAPIYIITGGAGNVENLSDAPDYTTSWNALHDYTHYGFNTVQANRTVMSWKYLSNTDQSVLDEFVVAKSS